MASSSSSTSSTCGLIVDDSYFSVLLASDEMFPISDEKYAEVLQLQEALLSSVVAIHIPKYEVIENTMTISQEVDTSVAEYFKTAPFFCEICMEMKAREELFEKNKCSHSFCFDCVSKHIAAKIQVNINFVTCPDLNCIVVLEPEACQSFLPKQVFDRWMDALCESFVLGSQKFYCPFKDCSVMFIDDGGESVTESECPSCRRLFCAECKVPWHSYISCEDFQRLNTNERGVEDIMLRKLAQEKKWNRCPRCKFYVEKRDGCLHITCRCGFQFCYGCGETWTSTHGGCQRA